MFTFLRKIRHSMIQSGLTRRYIFYAIGEIALVVIGILIALQINNWNEHQKLLRSERMILQDMIEAIDNDIGTYEDILEPRLERKKAGIDTLTMSIGSNRRLHDSVLMSLFFDISTDVVARYDPGPYEALKSSGFELITNNELRSEIVQTYGVVLPAYLKFVQVVEDEYNPAINAAVEELFISKVTYNSRGNWTTRQLPRDGEILFDPLFARIIDFEGQKYRNYARRLESMKNILLEMKKEIQEEIGDRK